MPASSLDPPPKQISQELQKLDRRATTTAETVATLQHENDELKKQLTATRKALAQTETNVDATEKMVKSLDDDLRSLHKELDELRNARDEDNAAFKKHVNLSEQSTGKLNKLWNKVEGMERRKNERGRVKD